MLHRLLWAPALLAAVSCSQQVRPAADPDIVATVNGEAITRQKFEQELAREAQPMEGDAPRTPEQIEPFKQTLLDTMIHRLLLLQAARGAGITVTSEEVDRRVLALASEYPAGSFEDVLAKNQTSRTEFSRRTREQLTIEKLFNEQVFARVAATEEQIRKTYDEHADDFTDPEQVHALQIVVKGLDEAKKVQGLLYQGKKFQDLARRYSLSPDAKVGGDLGFFARGQMPPAFDDVVFRLAPGQVSDVVSTDYGYHLFKVLEKKPAKKRDLNEVREKVEAKVLERLRSEKEKEFVAQLRAKAELKINEAILPTVTGRVVPGQAATEP